MDTHEMLEGRFSVERRGYYHRVSEFEMVKDALNYADRHTLTKNWGWRWWS